MNERLTNRELEIVELVAKGYTNQSIAIQLNLSKATIKSQLARIFSKVECTNRANLIYNAIHLGYKV